MFANTVAAQVATGNAPATVSVNQPAVEPSDPIRPNYPLYLGFGALLSLLIAAAVAVVRDRLDRRLRIGPRDDTVQGQLILARIPDAARAGRGERERCRVVGRRGRAHPACGCLARSAHKSRSRHGQGRPNDRHHQPGERRGKTTIAAQLALTLATDREKVAIVECDLRHRALDECGFGSQ